MRKKRKTMPQVILYILSSSKASRDKLCGILKYERLHGPWHIHLYEGRPYEQHLLDLRKWGTDGIIMEAGEQPWIDLVSRQIVNFGIHVVTVDPLDHCLQPKHPLSQFSKVAADGAAIGIMGAEYFLARGFKNFAFVDDIVCSNWSRFRRKAFVDRIVAAGYSCCVYPELTESERNDWAIEHHRMVEWLKSLPKPTGIMAAMDVRGRQILDACLAADINVPSSIQVLGVDDDEMICEATSPPMSSIATDGEKGGFLAAQLLDRLMDCKMRKKRTLSYQPVRVVERRSTEAVLFEDRLVANAMKFIHVNAGIGIGAVDVARHLKVSQRLLQLHFKESLGYPVIEEIMRVRFNRVCTLLNESDLSIGKITRICGFESESYLGRIFKKRFGMTMSQFRRERGFE